jgi:putative FmdB family regulatory protein
MPLYSYECSSCHTKFTQFATVDNRHNVRCGCGVVAEKLLGGQMRTEIFQPMWYDDICETPIWVESKGQLREECKKHDVIACRLL